MAIYPAGSWRPLSESNLQPGIVPTQVILHTAVSGASSLFGFFQRSDVTVESHFYVNQTGVEQYIDTGRRADANRHANARAISIETWDGGDPERTPWTDTQMRLLVNLVAWCCVVHDIPVRQCLRWDAPGIGWHVMFGAPGPWTPVSKSCPGGPRIAQMPELIGRVAAVVEGGAIEEDEVALTYDETKNALRDVLNEATAPGQLTGAGTIRHTLVVTQNLVNAVAAIGAQLKTLDVDADIDPEELRAALAEALPDEVVETILDGLHERLAS